MVYGLSGHSDPLFRLPLTRDLVGVRPHVNARVRRRASPSTKNEAQIRERDERTMDEIRIILAGSWTAMMLAYLLGDVIRIFAGDFTSGEMNGVKATQVVWLGAALIMLIPIVMLVLSLIVPYPAIKWISIVVAALLVLFNLAGLPYPGLYDNFLIVASFMFNGLIIWRAWTWIA